MISIVQRSAEEVEARLASAWQCAKDRTALVSATIAEHLRAMIYGASSMQVHASARRSIHTTRLMASARRMIELTWPRYAPQAGFDGQGGERDMCSIILQRIEALGDAVDTGKGQWVAAPLRIVEMDSARAHLLVGAAPVMAVHRITGVAPSCAGASRFITTQALEATSNRDFVQPVDAWLGHMAPLSAWTAQVLGHHEARMEAVQDLSAEHLEIYAPDVTSRQRRPGRWIAAAQIGRPLHGPRLCRPHMRYARSYDQPFYLGHFEFKSGALALQRCAAVEYGLTLRLRFGLDAMLTTPRRLSISVSERNVTIDRPFSLPYPESRVYALGWEDNVEGEGSERLSFHLDAMPFVMHALRRVSVDPIVTLRNTR